MDRVREYVGYDLCEKIKGGKPCSICILDSGIIAHKDFDHRIIEFKDFVDGRISISDPYGHGTHIAGICAGSGILSNGKYQGMSPTSTLVIGKVLGDAGEGKIETLLDGIQWCIRNQKKYNIRLLNISVGLIQKVDLEKQQALLNAVEHAWDLGIVTVCAAGNNGPKPGSVTIPGTSAKVITVGSVKLHHHYESLSNYSGRGPTTQCVAKPEIYAPGNNIMSCANNGWYTKKTGTSMSVPIVAGGIALLLQKKPYLSPVEVKLRLFENSKQLQGLEHHSWGTFYLPYFLSDRDS